MSNTQPAHGDPAREAPRSAPGSFAWPGSASTPVGPTRPQDYAVINGAYLVGLAGVAALATRSGRRDGVPLSELPVMAVAAFALAEVLARQKVECALGLVGLRNAAPGAGRCVSTVLATAGANHYLQAGFDLLRETGNATKVQAEVARPT